MYGGGGQYDGNGGAANASNNFDGGGFMPPQTTSTPEVGSGVTKTRGAQTLLPLTLKQIMDASQTNDDRFSFSVNGTEVSTGVFPNGMAGVRIHYGIPVNIHMGPNFLQIFSAIQSGLGTRGGCSISARILQVRLVGRMLNKNEQVTDVSFVLDDGTCRIDVKRWLNETFDTEEMEVVKDGDYVIVIGGLKSFQGKRQVVAFSVRLVTNYNDITHHFLHCIYVHLDLARPKRSSSQPQVNATTSTWNQTPHTSNQAPTSSTSGNAPGNGIELSDLVMSVFHDPVLGNLEHGVSVDQVASRLKLSDGQAREAVVHLVDLGNLYATIDDDHYKSTLNG